MLSNYGNVADYSGSICQNSRNQNGRTHSETAESSELGIDDETETVEQLYEQVKDHPLARLIGTYDETDDCSDITDASMNVHKYRAKYHAERHAKNVPIGFIDASLLCS